MSLNTDQRVTWNRAILAAFVHAHGSRMFSSAECDLCHSWQSRGVPLAVILQGVKETGGKPRTLHACVWSVEANIARHQQAVGLKELPAAKPLDAEWEAEWDAQKVADEKARIMQRFSKRGSSDRD